LQTSIILRKSEGVIPDTPALLPGKMPQPHLCLCPGNAVSIDPFVDLLFEFIRIALSHRSTSIDEKDLIAIMQPFSGYLTQ